MVFITTRWRYGLGSQFNLLDFPETTKRRLIKFMIKSLKLTSYRGFSNTIIEFSNITCIIGENSTGKSTIIEAIRDLLTTGNPIPQNHCKVGMYCHRKFRPLSKPRLCYNTILLKGVSDGETKTKKLHSRV